MQAAKLCAIILLCGFVIVTAGCVPGERYEDLKVQNRMTQERLAELESELSATKLQLGQVNEQLSTADSRCEAETSSLNDEIAALDKTLEERKALIASMRQRLLLGGGALPVELIVKLEEFADRTEMVTYDATREVLKFKSDLLFTAGSDKVTARAIGAVKSLCSIINSNDGKGFDIIVAGHTDDQPIRYSKARHSTNWHLSAHRAIAVLNIMANNGVSAKRLSIRGFGEYRPVVKNKPNKKGSPQNRRVEIYIVPSGM